MKVRTMNDYINDIATEIAEEVNNLLYEKVCSHEKIRDLI